MAPANPDPPTRGTDDSDDDIDIDATFAKIVQDFGEGPLPDTPPREERLDPVPDESPPRPALDSFPRTPSVKRYGPRDWPTTPDVEALEESQSHFTPEDPPPILGRSPLINVAWSLVAGVPIALLILIMIWRPFPVIVGQISAALFFVGIGLLIWKMPHRRDPSDDDLGAAV